MPYRHGYRVSQIDISLASQGGLPFIRLQLQPIEVDDNNDIVSVGVVTDQIIFSALEILTESFTITDPVTQQIVSISGAGAAELVRQIAISRVNIKHGTVFDASVGDTGKAMFE